MEFLAFKNIPLAQTTAQSRVRRSKMRLGAGILPPQHPTVSALKITLANKMKDGTLTLGNPIAPTSHNTYYVNQQTNTVQTRDTTVHCRQISLIEIRRKLLKQQLQMGLVRCEQGDLQGENTLQRNWTKHSI